MVFRTLPIKPPSGGDDAEHRMVMRCHALSCVTPGVAPHWHAVLKATVADQKGPHMARRRRVDRYMREQRERKYRLRSRSQDGRFPPDKDSDFALQTRNFAAYLADHAERMPLSAEQIAGVVKAVEEFRAALAKTLRPDSCGPRATRLKNQARADAEKIIRAAGRLLRADESLTPVDRFMLFLKERPKRLKRRECPQVAPVLRFIGSSDPLRSAAAGSPVRHILEYGNDFDHSSNAKPHGAVRLELFVGLVPPQLAAEGKVPAHPRQLSCGPWYLRSFSSSRFEIEFPVLSDGTAMLVVYWGRWADSRGNVGPFSKTCVARVEGGPAAQLPMWLGRKPALESANMRIEPKLEFMQLPAAIEAAMPRMLDAG